MLRLISGSIAAMSRDKTPRLGAALAYYAVFSLVPLLLLTFSIARLILPGQASQAALFEQISIYLGEPVSEILNAALLSLSNAETSLVATLITAIVLLIGATGVFRQLKDALNTVWHVEKKEKRNVGNFIYKNVLAVITILIVGALLMGSTIIALFASSITETIAGSVDFTLLQITNVLLSLLISTFVIAIIFTVFPSKQIDFRKMIFPAFLTTLLLALLRLFFSFYLNVRDVGAAYGAAGSVVVFLLWIYLATQIFLFGAEFSRLYAKKRR